MMSRRLPNVILCLCDQLRAFEVGCYGHPVVRTPNMDRLAAEGARFEVACASSPLCVPARSALLTGQYASTCTGTNSNYVGFPPSPVRVRCTDPTLAEVLRDAGYRTALVGKWHLHPAPDLVGFDEAVYPHNLHRHFGQTFYDHRGGREVVPGFSLDYEMGHVRRVVRASRNRPFFLLYSLSPPHMPLNDAPEKYLRMYPRERVVLRRNALVDGRPAHDPRAFRRYLWDYLGHLPGNLEGDEASMTEDYDQRNRERPLHGLRRLFRDVWRLLDDPELGPLLRRRLPYLDPDIVGRTDLVDLYRLYYGMTTCVDDRVGEMMSMLDGEGLLRDTLIVFTSDHGDMLGSHGLWNKGYVYEEAIRIPLLVRPPGGMAGLTVRDQVAGQVDVMPTVLGLVGLPTPPTVQGADLSAVVVGPAATAGEGAAYIEAHHRQIGVRTRDHLYAIPMLGNPEPDRRPAENTPDHLFFDLRTDPFQLRNLAAAAEAEGVGRDLRDRLLRWRAATPWKRP